MSRQYDAKQAALKAYSEDREAAIDLFVQCCGADKSDIEYEEGMSCEEYIFGNVINPYKG